MTTVGITGASGFLGTHLRNTLALYSDVFKYIVLRRESFDDVYAIDSFVMQSDVIVHLAGINRDPDASNLYETNIALAEKLISSLYRTKSIPSVIFTSSAQEGCGSVYGESKRLARQKFVEWAAESGGLFTGLIVPNVFGPFGKAFYNSVVSTFCHQLVSGEQPTIISDSVLNLVYVDDVVHAIIDRIRSDKSASIYNVPPRYRVSVAEIYNLLESIHNGYRHSGQIPSLTTPYELNMFNTYRSFYDVARSFPLKYVQHEDSRGAFTELIQLQSGGQVSFSTTNPGFTRGNHFHTRKVERFSVIAGHAKMQLRRVGTDQVIDMFLTGDSPAYVDIPVWYVHNIKNVGTGILVTVFWINEKFNSIDSDTYPEVV